MVDTIKEGSISVKLDLLIAVSIKLNDSVLIDVFIEISCYQGGEFVLCLRYSDS